MADGALLSQASVGTRRSCAGCQLSRHALRCARTTRLTTLLAACALGSSCWYTSNKPTQDHPTQFRHGCSCHLSQKESMSWRHGNLRPGTPSFTDPCIRRYISSFLFTPCHGTILRVASCSTQNGRTYKSAFGRTRQLWVCFFSLEALLPSTLTSK